MNVLNPIRAAAAAFILGGAMSIGGTASAVTLQTVVAPIYQIGNGALAQIGHTAIGRTNYNRLGTGGSFTAACGGAGVVPVTGSRFETAENFAGGLYMPITIPRVHPATVTIPGFYEAATRGQSMSCAYNWNSRAVEGGYSIGIGGISFQTGNGEALEGGSQPFVMNVPGLGNESGWTGCIP